MAVRGVVNHTHKYYQLESGVWACGDCSHYLPKNVARMIYSRFSRCWKCEKLVKMEDKIMNFAVDKNDGEVLCEECMEKKQEALRLAESYDEVLEKIKRGEV